MQCFYHPGVEAVGVCKNCGKALCHDSLMELGQFLACKENEACQARVSTASEMIGMSRPFISLLKLRLIIAIVAFAALVVLVINFLLFAR
ncbi:MAG: hypothetical protein A3A33_03160 [Candidatus Yanofskybacteria bacterium RIFCSPLOWO2_01_FULL_49_25]|uniref:B box-type domain-containing protein n=1 Tax=Candidatus Yanofskybacteria bacterium RIFCSPLOWO2_01_FULL_49_25 TaxID=1802701 RepID=A0A1F8GTJ8_9BACT|nr:MAG: hypothetical protein A3A33_03160 [Candidatus Yanofskybacteria bacterium RIFCSPLOWO2_01_FULL_49_25]